MVSKNQPYRRKIERWKVFVFDREDIRVERKKINYHYILLLKVKEWKSGCSFVLLFNTICSFLFYLIWKEKKKVWKILSIFFSRPFYSNQKTEYHIFLSPFPFSVFPQFPSQPNSVKIEWNSRKECEGTGTQREKKFDDNYKENNRNKVGFVCGVVRLPHVIKSDVSRHMLLMPFWFQKPLIALFA